jgi:hypothetical protein
MKAQDVSEAEFQKFCDQLESLKGKFPRHWLWPEWEVRLIESLPSKVLPD